MPLLVANGLDLANQRIQNVASPSAGTDAVNRNYVDNIAAGLSWKEPVRAATTANGALATAFENGDVIDGVTLATGNRILIKDQTTQSENGIYVVAASGAPARASDADATGDLKAGTAVAVTEGTVNADKAFLITGDDQNIVIGTDPIVWGAFAAGITYTGGDGITVTGTVIDVDLATSSGLTFSSGELLIDSAIVVRKFAVNIGNGSSTTITVTHNLGTLDISVEVFENASGSTILCDVTRTDTNNVNLVFATAPTSNQYRAVIHG